MSDNLSPNSNSEPAWNRYSMPLADVAVVAEGGGQRGIFTAGVLDGFLSRQFNPFQIGLGVSAGAQNLLSFFLGEQGYAKRAITELTAAPGFFVPYRWLGSRGVIDLDHYFETTLNNPEYRLPYQRLSSIQKHRQLRFVATNRDTLVPVYLNPNRQNVVHYLKASSAVPFLYKAPVEVQQQLLVDGGIADPLPVHKAIAMGAKNIVVVRTVGAQVMHSSWRQRIDALPVRRAVPGIIRKMVNVHDKAYTDALHTIHSPPEGVSIMQIAPEQSLRSHAFGSKSESIVYDYEVGFNSGTLAVDNIQQWLSQQNRSNLRKLSEPEIASMST